MKVVRKASFARSLTLTKAELNLQTPATTHALAKLCAGTSREIKKVDESHKNTWKGLAGFLVALGFLILLPEGTLYYWQGWIYLAVFFISTTAITLYLMKKDLAMLARRMNADFGYRPIGIDPFAKPGR